MSFLKPKPGTDHNWKGHVIFFFFLAKSKFTRGGNAADFVCEFTLVKSAVDYMWMRFYIIRVYCKYSSKIHVYCRSSRNLFRDLHCGFHHCQCSKSEIYCESTAKSSCNTCVFFFLQIRHSFVERFAEEISTACGPSLPLLLIILLRSSYKQACMLL